MIPLFKVFMADDAKRLVGEVLDSGYVGQGPKVDEFERQLADVLDLREPPLALNSCTSALELALYLCGVGPGTEVVSTPVTCTATNGAIARLGGRIRWADVDPVTGNIDPASATRVIDGATVAIVTVDWGGRLCDYGGLRAATAPNYRLPIIQDAAHSFLAYHCGDDGEQLSPTIAPYRKQPYHYAYLAGLAGGDYLCWSFQAIKHLTTGDGGALLTPPEQMERARLLRWYGLDRRSSQDFRCAQSITEIGWKAHLNDVAAAIGLANLPHARWVVAQHRRNAEWYHRALAGVEGAVLPPPDPGGAWWLYTMLVPDRADFIRHLAERGVHASPVHRRNDEHPAFQAIATTPEGGLPGVEAFASRNVAIPVGWWLSEQDRERVAEAVWTWSQGRRTATGGPVGASA